MRISDWSSYVCSSDLRYLGLDLGTKTIGLALSDAGHRIATPLRTLIRKKFTQDAAGLAGIVTAENVGALVLGLPVNMDGSEGPRCQAIGRAPCRERVCQ